MSTITSAIEDRPVELLRDQRGVYGIGVSDFYDFEARAWACGVEQLKPEDHYRCPPSLILRPDRLDGGLKPHRAVLQKIIGGFRRGPFMRSHEERIRQFIHHQALERAGLPWPNNGPSRWWSSDKKQQARNRGIYHGLRQLSLCVINDLIGKALEEAADAEAVKAARRFTFEHREDIYRASALSNRALQLTETFPVLALLIYSNPWRLRGGSVGRRHDDAARLVERGARLRDVAGIMNVPMALRHIKPGVAHLVTDVFYLYPEFLTFMPDTTPRQRIWLLVVDWACRNSQNISADFGQWAARHVAEIPGRSHREVGSFLGDISDWAAADAGGSGREFVTRPFTPTMSLKTATLLSAEWHEAVANNLDGPNAAFPSAWFPAAKIGDTEIVPIEDAATLYREGSAMHHCVGTYRHRVQSGELYVYSMRSDGERIATLALGRYNGKVHVDQIRGPCNVEPPKAIITTVQRWLRAQKPSRPPAIMEVAAVTRLAEVIPLFPGDDAIAIATQRGRDAHKEGMRRKAVPLEYRDQQRVQEAAAWLSGWDLAS
jgi:hypothetical protein